MEKAWHSSSFQCCEIIKTEFTLSPRQYLTWSRSCEKKFYFFISNLMKETGKFFRYLANFHNIFLMIRWFNKTLHSVVDFCNFEELSTFIGCQGKQRVCFSRLWILIYLEAKMKIYISVGSRGWNGKFKVDFGPTAKLWAPVPPLPSG